MGDHVPIVLWRLVPTVAFLGIAVPLYLRAMLDVIRESPKTFSRWMTFCVLLAVAVAITAWAIFAWWLDPPLATSIRDYVPIVLWRLVPTVLFLGIAVPLYLRAITGVIPAYPGENRPIEIRRRESPKTFWRWMAFYLLLAIAITAWAIIAWCVKPPLA